MKIACVSTSSVPSSTANSIQVMKVCHALAQLGHQVVLLLPENNERNDPASQGWERLSSHYGLATPFEIRWLKSSPAWKRYDFAWKAVRTAKSMQAGLIYTWTAQAGWFSLLNGIPVILEMHDRVAGRLGPFVFRQYLTWPGHKRTLVITEALAHVLETDFRVRFSPEQLIIAPNGVDLERYANLPDPTRARQVLGLPEGCTAVYSGHFYAGRGMNILFSLALNFPQVQFLWIGGRPEDVERMRVRLEKAGLKNVLLTGFIENSRLPPYQAAGDILLMPYERAIEGSSGGNSADICSPMKMFDYLASGRAIITSDLPVIREVLNEKNAVFCPPDDIPAWQEAFGALIADPSRRQALSAQARQDGQRYNWITREEKALNGF